MTDRVDLLQADILAGPDALARLLDAYAADGGPLDSLPRGDLAGRRLVFSGLGSSRYASLTAVALLRAGGIGAWAEFASSSMPTRPGADVVLVAVSASGRTREVVDAIGRHRGTSLVIGVTNEPGSQVATEADICLPLLAGEEASGIATRTFRATLAVLGLLAGGLLDGSPDVASLRPAVARLAAVQGDDDSAAAEAAADLLDGATSIDVIGDETDLGTVEQAALMLREGPRLAAAAHETGDWLHTAVYLALPGHRAILYPRSAADVEVIATIRRRGGEVVTVDHVTGLDDPIARGLVDSSFAELLALELWRRASAQDKEP